MPHGPWQARPEPACAACLDTGMVALQIAIPADETYFHRGAPTPYKAGVWHTRM